MSIRGTWTDDEEDERGVEECGEGYNGLVPHFLFINYRLRLRRRRLEREEKIYLEDTSSR